ncbi:hypothetical protein M1555_01065 [Patescibacteria group bacterium]|nr:hypothetical protein [Patescibacteria group bacterium]
MSSLFFIQGVSLITAFAGGMVALFAPCCITFLLPSYLANIFRSRAHILAMTVVFGLGIATVLVPTALGIRAVGELFTRFHTGTYLVGSLFMVLLGVMELTGKKITLPMIHLTIDLSAHRSTGAVYVLGVFSGITSSCCTPVLAGVLTLSFLSPTFLWAGLAGTSYVFGMVVPLVILALILDRVNWSKVSGIRTKQLTLAGKTIPLTDAIAGVLYIAVGVTFSVLALTRRITMGTSETPEQMAGVNVMHIVEIIRSIPGSEYVFGILIVLAVIAVIRKGMS